MKRVFVLLLCLAMVFSMAACGNDATEPTKPQETPGISESTPDEPTSGETTPDDTEPSNPVVDENTVRPNGELPEDEDDLTRAEVNHYIGKVMQAIINLDVETMKEYANSHSAYMIKAVKEDDVYRAVWEKTIGKSVYLEESNMLVYKDPQFVFTSWLTDLYKNGDTLKAAAEEYTEEEIVAILDKYIDKAPYLANELDIEDDFKIDIEDGKIVIDCNDCLGATPWDRLSDISVPHPTVRTGKDLACLAFGAHCEVSLGLDYINTNGFTIWEALVTADLDKIVTAFDNAPYDMNIEITSTTNHLYEFIYQTYYKDAEKRAKIQDWMDEHVMILRSLSSVWVYIPAELTDTYPYCTLTDAEKDLIKDLNIYIKEGVFEFQANTSNEFSPFYEIVVQMSSFGAIEWIK